jgi:hypothetical protein
MDIDQARTFLYSPEYAHPAYMVYPRQRDNPVMQQALEGLRELAAQEHG